MSHEALRIGEVVQFDGVAMLARGDVLLVAHRADASVERARWLHEMAEQFLSMCEGSFLAIMVIAANSKPPDQATREIDAAGFTRIALRLRRLVVVPEGSGFRASLVRLVIGAYITLTGKATLVVAPDADQGISRLYETKTALTPNIAQLTTDLARLRAVVGMTDTPRLSGRAANK